MPVKDVTEAMLLDALRKVEKRGAIDTAHRLPQIAYAAAGVCEPANLPPS